MRFHILVHISVIIEKIMLLLLISKFVWHSPAFLAAENRDLGQFVNTMCNSPLHIVITPCSLNLSDLCKVFIFILSRNPLYQ